MSNPFKAIGKVFKSVVKAVGKVVKTVVKVVKKVAPYVLMAAAVYFGGAALMSSFSAGGAGLAAGTASTATTGLTAGFGATSEAFATMSGFGATAGNAGLATLGGTATTASSVGGSIWGGIRAAGSFIQNNSELVKLGAGALNSIQTQKTAEKEQAYKRESDDKYIAQRKAEDEWNGGVMGVDRAGVAANNTGNANAATYTPTQSAGQVNDENARMDTLFAQSQGNSGLLDLYNQAYYKQQQQA